MAKVPPGITQNQADSRYPRVDASTQGLALSERSNALENIGLSYVRADNRRSVGIFEMPSGFSWPVGLPAITAYRTGEKYACSVEPEDIIDPTAFTALLYVHGTGGNDSNDGLTWSTSKKSIESAMKAATTSGVATRILVYAPAGPYYRQIGVSIDGADRSGSVPIMLEAMCGRVVTGPWDNLTYTLASGATKTYQATRSNVLRVFNPAATDANGGMLEYTYKTGADNTARIAAVEAAAGSWSMSTDGSTFYVHPSDNSAATNANTRAILNAANLGWNGNANLYIRGFDFQGGKDGAIKIFGGSTNRVVAVDCTFNYSAASNTQAGGSTTIDGVHVYGCGLAAFFGCSANWNQKDGFNVHATGAVKPAMLTINCVGCYNGVSPSTSNNGLTAHEGCSAIDIGGLYLGNFGSASGHVDNDTHVWMVGATAGNSPGDIPFYGSSSAAYRVWSGTVKMWLDSCRDCGAPEGINASGGANVYVRGHLGTGSRSGSISSF